MKHFHAALHRWYAAHGRHDLPWRTTDDAYRIYLSEVMLQQTQVKTVLERFYFPFLKAFPSLQALANAPEEAVIKQWEGLGYYSRARNLHKAAKLCCSPHPNPLPRGEGTRPTSPLGRGQNDEDILGEGSLPNSYGELLALPGIGKNTAHAILAFAYRKPYPVLEANVKRLIHRIFAIKDRDDKALWAAAWELLDTANPFDYNQAMMDLGALICTPKAPQCLACPAATICKGKKSPLTYPEPKAKKQTPIRRKHILVLRDANGRYHLSPRRTRFLGGLYGFIELPESSLRGSNATKAIHTYFALDCHVVNAPRKDEAKFAKLGNITQTYSHFKLEAEVFLVQLKDAMNAQEWFTFEEMQSLPLSGAEQKIAALLQDSHQA